MFGSSGLLGSQDPWHEAAGQELLALHGQALQWAVGQGEEEREREREHDHDFCFAPSNTWKKNLLGTWDLPSLSLPTCEVGAREMSLSDQDE